MALWSILLIACSSYFQKEATRVTAATKCVAVDSWSRRESLAIQRMATHVIRLSPRCGLLMVVDSVSPQIDMENDIPNQSRNEQINAKDLSPHQPHTHTKKTKKKCPQFSSKLTLEMLSKFVDLLLRCCCRAKSNRPHQSPRPLWPCARQVKKEGRYF